MKSKKKGYVLIVTLITVLALSLVGLTLSAILIRYSKKYSDKYDDIALKVVLDDENYKIPDPTDHLHQEEENND